MTPSSLQTYCPVQLLNPRRWLPTLIVATLLSAIVPSALAQVDPPTQVARLSLVEGSVSFAAADAANNASSGDPWRAAELNRPLTSRDRLWTGPGARSELHIGSTALHLSEQTSLDILVLNDTTTQLRLAQGSLIMRVRVLFQGQRVEVITPNLAFILTQPGNYRLDVNPATNITRVVAQQGGGMLYGNGVAPLLLGSSQQASFSGTQLTPATPSATYQDSFDAWAQERDRREEQSISARYVPRETIGYQQLDSYGNWSQDTTYGAVWMPNAVSDNWAPYRGGHWGWVAPWGWTWIDDAPWGFAPFHYGRWAQIGLRWAWVPGQLPPRPVYAPALVAFIGGSIGNVSWNLSIGGVGAPQPSVGWFPLAPGEAFRPSYAASPRYAAQINNNIVINNNNITNVYRYQHLPRAVSVVSRANFASGQPVRLNTQTMSGTDLARTQVVYEHGALPQRRERVQRTWEQQPVAALPPAALLNAQPALFSTSKIRNGQGTPNQFVNSAFKSNTTVIGAPVTAIPSVQPSIPLLGRGASIAAEEQQTLRNKHLQILPITEPQLLAQQRLQRNQIEQAQRQQALQQNEHRQQDQARQQRDHQERQWLARAQQQQQIQMQIQQHAQQAQVKQRQEQTQTQTQERLEREQGQKKQQGEQRLQPEKLRQLEAARAREPHLKSPIIREQHDKKPS